MCSSDREAIVVLRREIFASFVFSTTLLALPPPIFSALFSSLAIAVVEEWRTVFYVDDVF
jgi:hypothetical protein